MNAMKSIVNLTGDSELPAHILDEIDVMEVIEPTFTPDFDRADEPGFITVLSVLLSDLVLPSFPNAANSVVLLPGNVQPDSPAVETIRAFLPQAEIIIL